MAAQRLATLAGRYLGCLSYVSQMSSNNSPTRCHISRHHFELSCQNLAHYCTNSYVHVEANLKVEGVTYFPPHKIPLRGRSTSPSRLPQNPFLASLDITPTNHPFLSIIRISFPTCFPTIIWCLLSFYRICRYENINTRQNEMNEIAKNISKNTLPLISFAIRMLWR